MTFIPDRWDENTIRDNFPDKKEVIQEKSSSSANMIKNGIIWELNK